MEESEEQGDVAGWNEDAKQGQGEKTEGYGTGKVDFGI